MAELNLDLLTAFQFGKLFINELGWDRPVQQQPLVIEVGDNTFELHGAAHKRGVQVLQCNPSPDGRIPPYAARQKIERRVTREVREHLIVFVDAGRTTQIWQWVNRQPSGPAQYRELVVQAGQAPELLRQKLAALRFTLDEEELLTVLGVTRRMDDSQPRERVTKRFYREFEQQRKEFAEFIAGIPRVGRDMAGDQLWYTAVLIDRLMFLWFLQGKGFLDGRRRYLRERLDTHLESRRSPSFYRDFLCPLFFRGFAEPRDDRNRDALRAEFGDVPYLNGGLFAQHQLEQQYGQALDVADAAFDKLFAFFDEWEWHLDERPMRSGREINPDVLGYIFEKFVNQKQMGAYYTKEDITEYIGKNTIIPCLLQKVRAEHPAAFDALAWPLLQQSGDAYIYPAMGKGVDKPYPEEIKAGLDTNAPDLIERRKPWNRRADEAVSLPTEIWREAIARHQHTRELRRRIEDGEVRDIGDLITCNLDIRQFAQDLIENCTDLTLLRSFWFNLAGRLPRRSNEKFRHGLSVLDPTCGSGAFLFAALNILKPLYDATLRTLQAVRSDALIAGEQSRPEKWQEIDNILRQFSADGGERQQDYAVTKHVIVHNLYGVDIEEQATEIAKLRLFLKLVALLEPGDAIEPLPDIDFNIRHGNTLVGYASAEETERAVRGSAQNTSGNLFGEDPWRQIKLRLVSVEQAYNNFQIQQVQYQGQISAADKQALTEALRELEQMLNRHLAREYGVDPDKPRNYGKWESTHQPFHWYVDFYPLMAAGGFDAVIGNPPYIQISEVKEYSVDGYDCARCGNLYAVMIERCAALVHGHGRTGFIVPVSAISTDGYQALRSVYATQLTHVSCFDDRPSRLFDGLEHIRLVIMLSGAAARSGWITTRYHKWTSEERGTLFDRLLYFPAASSPIEGAIPKMGSTLEIGILSKLERAGRKIASHLARSGSHTISYTRKIGYFVQVASFVPHIVTDTGVTRLPSELKTLSFADPDDAGAALASLNSSLFYWFVTLLSDCRNLNKREVEAFRIATPAIRGPLAARVCVAVDRLMEDMQAQSETRRMRFRHDTLTIQCLIPKKSWPAIEVVDALIAQAFGLSQEQADYISGYEVKYRLGQDDQDDD
ncbi:MAG: Eco57I restriction-modification methylase domain-containing protein [Rhodanobacteraceae bacterium]